MELVCCYSGLPGILIHGTCMCDTPNRFQLLIAATRNRQPDRENVYANTRMTRANANWSGGNPCEFLQEVGSASRHLHFESFARQLRYPLETAVVPDNRVRPAGSLELLCWLPLGNFRQPGHERAYVPSGDPAAPPRGFVKRWFSLIRDFVSTHVCAAIRIGSRRFAWALISNQAATL